MTDDPKAPAQSDAIRLLQDDPVRNRIRNLLRERDATMREASLAIGRGSSYVHQFLERGVPKALRSHDRRALAEWLGCEPEELRHDRVPRRRPSKPRAPRFKPPQLPGAPVSAVREMAVDAAAGAGALNEDNAAEAARWYMPDAMIRHEGRTAPENLRILGARGDSMEPLFGEGDRIVVDVSRRAPVTGEMLVLWDGGGLVVKRVETLLRSEPPALRLHSANPAYEPYTCLADEAHIVGKVLWAIRKL
jgi:phage repressor protein C with HTH and peptisase S24 domain